MLPPWKRFNPRDPRAASLRGAVTWGSVDRAFRPFLSCLFPIAVVPPFTSGTDGRHVGSRLQEPDAPCANVPVSLQVGIFQSGRGVPAAGEFPTYPSPAAFSF